MFSLTTYLWVLLQLPCVLGLLLWDASQRNVMAMTASILQSVLPAHPTAVDGRHFIWNFLNHLQTLQLSHAAQVPLLQNGFGCNGTDLYDGHPEPKFSFDAAVQHLSEYFNMGDSVLRERKTFS